VDGRACAGAAQELGTRAAAHGGEGAVCMGGHHDGDVLTCIKARCSFLAYPIYRSSCDFLFLLFSSAGTVLLPSSTFAFRSRR
jgi:hypothetical protein